jgi:hypothetical protein
MKKSHSGSRQPKQIVNGDIDALVDRFVAKVNAGPREPIAIDIYRTPPSVLVGEPYDGRSDWMIKPYANIDWVESLENRLTHIFPVAYRSLISRYIFPGFEAANIQFFGNTPEGTDHYELREKIFHDFCLYKTLSPGGFVQFGRADPYHVGYDPVCFNMNCVSADDCPIVRIDSEEILCHDVIKVISQIASSFTELLETVVNAE